MKTIEDLRQIAKQESIPMMKQSGMDFMLEYIRAHKEISRILEVGTAIGLSAIQMALVREQITIDTLELDSDLAQEAIQNIEEFSLSDRIFVHVGDALDYNTFQYYDFYFIDAAKSQYHRYLEHFLPTSYVGSVFLFDNLNFHGIVDDPSLSQNRSTLQMTRKIKRFREALLKDPRFETIFYPEIGDGIALAKRIK